LVSKVLVCLLVLSLLFFLLLAKFKRITWEDKDIFLVPLWNCLIGSYKKEVICPGGRIIDSLAADFDRDKEDELALVVWKRGNYGSLMPFWVERNESDFSSHLFLYQLKGDKISPFWHSSKLEKPICSLKMEDLNEDGQLELVVWEGEYVKKGFSCQEQAKSYWRWNGWGFTKIEGSDS
jgi:hypothetical protein